MLCIRRHALLLAVEIGGEAPERQPEGDALRAAKWFVEEDDGEDLGHREEHGDDDSGEQRRAVVDGADYAEAEALVHGGCADQQHVVARLAEFGLPGFSWDCLRHSAQIKLSILCC